MSPAALEVMSISLEILSSFMLLGFFNPRGTWPSVFLHSEFYLLTGLLSSQDFSQIHSFGKMLFWKGFTRFTWATRRRGVWHRFDDCAGAPTNEALGRSRGGFPTKIHLRTNAKGDPLTFELTGGEMHEVKGYDALMKLHDADPVRDKGYDSDEIRADLAKRGIEPVIPPRSNRKEQIDSDRDAHKRRNLIERCVNRLKQLCRIAPRYEKTARAYLSMLLRPQGSGSKPSTRPRYSSL